jgi:hypothetical protein
MPSSIDSKASRGQSRIASALGRDNPTAAQVQVSLTPDARALVDDAVFGDGIGSRMFDSMSMSVSVSRMRGTVVVVAGAASLSGPVGAADV